ncbi:LysR family transcriptional regulator [Sciscionella sediminilitoris]|uniref:LysR family transcriptional regulator n=1 Tax=Sciscionella sediminilitoris TaxID=1445613 RepID=UPI0004DF8F1D|nr:LysR family transcriptional regulator [Sciscionella sp. SE31]
MLHLTPSGVSQQLTKLEAETGIALIDRGSRGGGRAAEFTRAGHALAEHAETLADTLAAVDATVSEFREQPVAQVRIGGFSVVLSELLAPVVLRLATTNPGLNVCIWETTETEGVEALREGRLDLLLSQRPGPGEPARAPDLVETSLFEDPLRVLVPRSWPVGDEPAELLARPWFTSSLDPASQRELRTLSREHGITLDERDIGAANAPTLLSLVANGLGATIVPELTLGTRPNPNIRVSEGILTLGSRTLSVLRLPSVHHPGIEELLRELRSEGRSRR